MKSTAAALLILLCAAACSTPRVRLIPRYAHLDIDGTVEIEPRGVSISARNDLDDLGIDDPEDAFLPRVDLDWERFHIIAVGYDVDWQGNGVAEADLELGNGDIITVGTPVATDVDYSITTANFLYDFFPRLPFELGLGLGVGYLDYDVSLEEIGGAGRVATEEELPFGCLSARLAKRFGKLELNLLLQGIEFELDDDEYLYWGGEATATYQFTTGRVGLGVMLGYMFQHIEFTYNNRGSTTDTEADVGGPVIGLVLTL